jgi:hypothetical protein
MRMMRVSAMLAALAPAAPALAQFGVPSTTDVKERIAGTFVEATGAPTPAAGDQIAAFYGGEVVGRFVVETDANREFEVIVYGDDPDTSLVEGPRRNQRVTFKYYDASSNQTIDLEVLNTSGELFNFSYQGEEVPPLPVPLPGLDLTPTRNLDLRVAGSDGGGSGGDDDDPGVKYDVDADGKITTEDAAQILRILSGASIVSADVRKRADVNGDGKVTTADAVEVLRNR